MSTVDWTRTHPRKSRIIGLIAILVLAGLFALSLVRKRSVAWMPQQAKFLGFTHAAPGGLRVTWPTNSAFLDAWYASGTNVALFSITNQQRLPVLLYPHAGFYEETNAVRPRYDTLLLNAPEGYGVLLQPGQAATVEVPVLRGRGPGRVRFGYTPDYKHFAPSALEMVRGLVRGWPADFRTEWFYSERIEP